MINAEVRKKNRNRLYRGISILFVLSAVVPLLISCCYAVPSADDFFAANNVRYYEMQGIPKLAIAGKETVALYLNHQGTFTGWFFDYLFSAWIKVRLVPTRITLFTITALFLCAVYFCAYVLIQRFMHDDKTKYTINFVYGLLIYSFTVGHNVREVFYWICGACIYTVPLIFMFVGIGFTICVLENRRKADAVIACVMCLLSTGGTLQIAAFTNVVLLGTVVFAYGKKRDWTVLPIFLCALAGALINVVAPGNYVRQNLIGAELDIILAVKNSAIAVLTGFRELLGALPCQLLVLLCILIGIRQAFMKMKEVLGVIFYVILSLIIIDFPVTLAYGTTYLEPRVLFVQNIAIVLVLLLISLCVGQTVFCAWRRGTKLRFKRNFYGAIGAAAMIMTAIFMYSGGWSGDDIMSLTICRNLLNGNMKKWDEAHKIIFQKLNNGENKDVVIENYPSDMGILYPMRLQADSDYWVNTGTARYYRCNTIVLKE